MKPIAIIEFANLFVLGGIGSYVGVTGVWELLTPSQPHPEYVFGFVHPPLTFAIVGFGLVLLCLKWKLYALPLFWLATNLVENPWVFYDGGWNIIQLAVLSFAYLLARPAFKRPVILFACILLNASQLMGFDWHHVSEALIMANVLLNIKSLKSLQPSIAGLFKHG